MYTIMSYDHDGYNKIKDVASLQEAVEYSIARATVIANAPTRDYRYDHRISIFLGKQLLITVETDGFKR